MAEQSYDPVREVLEGAAHIDEEAGILRRPYGRLSGASLILWNSTPSRTADVSRAGSGGVQGG